MGLGVRAFHPEFVRTKIAFEYKLTVSSSSDDEVSKPNLFVSGVCAGKLDNVVTGARPLVDLNPVSLVLANYYPTYFLPFTRVEPHLQREEVND